MCDKEMVRKDYITGDYTCRQLADKYEVGASTIARWSREGDWNSQRESYHKDVTDRAVKKQGDKTVDALAMIDEAAMCLLGSISKTVKDDEQYHLYLVSETDGIDHSETVERRYEKRDTKMMKELTSALKEALGIIRNVRGLPTQAEAENQSIASGRLKLEWDKWEHEKAREAEEKDNVIRVEFDDDVKELLE